jgi:hypothetical protein
LGSDRRGGVVELSVQVSGEASADDLAGLRAWLLDEPLLRGRVRLRRQPAPAGAMPGPVVDALLLAVAGGGAAAAAVRVRTAGSVLIAWLKGRRGDIQVTVTGPQDRSVSLNATNVKGLSSTEISALLDRLADVADGLATVGGVETGQTGDDGEGSLREPNGSSKAAE